MVNTTAYVVCESCKDIVVQGYSDAVEDVVAHQALANHIDGMLKDGEYWLGSPDSHQDISLRCEACDRVGVSHRVHAARND